MGSKLWSSLLIIVLLVSCQQPHPQVKYLKGFALGTSYNIQYDGNATGEEIQNGIDALFYELNRSLSTYLPQSDISKINRGDTTVVVDHHFKAVFEKATERKKQNVSKVTMILKHQTELLKLKMEIILEVN